MPPETALSSHFSTEFRSIAVSLTASTSRRKALFRAFFARNPPKAASETRATPAAHTLAHRVQLTRYPTGVSGGNTRQTCSRSLWVMRSSTTKVVNRSAATDATARRRTRALADSMRPTLPSSLDPRCAELIHLQDTLRLIYCAGDISAGKRRGRSRDLGRATHASKKARRRRP